MAPATTSSFPGVRSPLISACQCFHSRFSKPHFLFSLQKKREDSRNYHCQNKNNSNDRSYKFSFLWIKHSHNFLTSHNHPALYRLQIYAMSIRPAEQLHPFFIISEFPSLPHYEAVDPGFHSQTAIFFHPGTPQYVLSLAPFPGAWYSQTAFS